MKPTDGRQMHKIATWWGELNHNQLLKQLFPLRMQSIGAFYSDAPVYKAPGSWLTRGDELSNILCWSCLGRCLITRTSLGPWLARHQRDYRSGPRASSCRGFCPCLRISCGQNVPRVHSKQLWRSATSLVATHVRYNLPTAFNLSPALQGIASVLRH